MVIGVMQIELDIPGAMSLKDKRRVVKSIKDSCHRHHMVSVAEVGALDVWNRAMLGVSVVSNSGMVAGQVLDRVTERVRSVLDCEVVDSSREILRGDSLVVTEERDGLDGLEREMYARAEAVV
ncbi:MAG: DUF503 domain-containing protein [Phycisphaerales bacterium]|nr:DUF503 domain-containing protein [Phycisphaerales bacterium]